MAEVVTILSAISTSQQVLWQFSQLIGRYRGLPERILDLEENLHACNLTLQVWKARWGVEERHTNTYYEVLWGRKGWKTIQLCLSSIKVLSKLVQSDIDRVVGSALKYQGHHRNERYDGQFESQVMRRALARIDKRMSRKRRFFWSVILKADDLDYQITRFNKKLTNLERFAAGFLLDAHPSFLSRDPSQLQQETQHLVQDGMRDERRQMVRGTREDAESVYKAWDLAEENLQCHLAIARLNEQVRDPMLDKNLYFILSNGGKATEVRLKPVTFEDPEERRRLPNSLTDAFHSATAKPRSTGDLLPPGAIDGSGFEVHINSRAALAKLDRSDPLSVILARTQFSSISALTAKDKVAIAVSLVGAGYRFLGTPWMHFLDTANIRGDRSGDGTWTAMLCAQIGSRSVHQALARLSSSRSYQNFDLDRHKQVFRLGIVLTELAIGSLVSHAEASDNIRVPGISLVLPELADEDRLDADEIATEVESSTGSESYGNLVRFCLSVLQSRSKIKELSIDDRTYEMALLEPAKTLSDLVKA